MHVLGGNLSIFRRLVGERTFLLSDSPAARVTRCDWESSPTRRVPKTDHP
jgi:hypothetical protein